MLKNLDIRIDKALKVLSNSIDCIASSSDLGDNNNIFGDNNIVILLVDRNLAVRTDDKEFVFELMLPTCRISKNGAEIIEKGGWLKHLEREKIKSDRIERKDVLDFKVSKFKYHTFWWFFGFALIGLGLSVYNFTDNLSPSKNIKQQEDRIEKMELELTKLQTSISDKKNLHSLHNTKVLKMKTNKEE
jgi:hypothetical protein